MRQWRGHTVRVSGDHGTINVKITDYGPAKWTKRIIDLNDRVFQAVCGKLSRGTCIVTVTLVN